MRKTNKASVSRKIAQKALQKDNKKPQVKFAKVAENEKKRPVNPRFAPKEYLVDEPMILFDFLVKTYPSLSRNNVKSLLARRQVAVDGAPMTQFDFMLSKGDMVIVARSSIKTKDKQKLPILYEDDEIIAFNKPSGLLSVATDKEKGQTAYRMLMEYVREKDPKGRIFIVHRIDKDTSGVLIVAKSEKLRDALQDDWNRLVSKRGYFAIVQGEVEKDKGTIRSWLLETKTNLMYSGHKKGEGQLAITHYEKIKVKDDYTLLNVHIDTGRKNQIRVHMKDLGHPIVGDDKYYQSESPIHRLGLHAYELEFTHPFTQKVMYFKADMPKEFKTLFNIHQKKAVETKDVHKN